MATTTYDQDIHITNRRNEGDNPFGEGELPSNPLEPGTPLTDAVPCLLLLAAAYALRVARKRHQTTNSTN
jgi:hypothetical protein